jgi:nitrite reductase (NADH) large subunit
MGLTVSVLLSADNIPNRQFDVRSRCQLRRYSEHRGIEILTGVNATSLIRDDLDRVRAVRLSNGNELKADLFLAGVDVRPDVSLAEAAGIATRNGLLVDDY